MTDVQRKPLLVADVLLTGKHCAIPGKALCDALGITPRDLTREIERERREGHPICASCKADGPGYFLAAHKEEMQAYCDSLSRRIEEVTLTLRACTDTIETLPERGEGENVEDEEQ